MKTFTEWFKYAAEELGGTSTGSVAGAGDDSSTVPVFKKKKRKMFDVPPHVFKRFNENERVKYERWAKYLGQGMYEDSLLKYVRDNKNADVVLRDQVSGEVKNITSIK
jgi:hypothetical protein